MRHLKSGFRPQLSLMTLGLAALTFAGVASAVPVTSALAPDKALGFYDASQFSVVGPDCKDCQATPQARFYFQGDVAVSPRANAVGFDPTRRTFEDLASWARTRGGKADGSLPSLLWTGSSSVATGVFAANGSHLADEEGNTLPLQLTPKIKSNLSYYNQASAAFFANRPVVARGELKDGTFIARTLWPADYSLSKLPAVQPLAAGESISTLVRADQGGARSQFAARVLWQRNPGQALDVAGKPALAFVLNGAQGDDDEAHGGHFAVATGAFGPKGEWDNWLVNNFYNLGSVSEKGIVASTLPMDAYMTDLNSGQAWYRPSHLVIAVLKDKRVPALYQEGIGRVFQHFYRQDFAYKHATANCTGLNVETLRTLGWKVPTVGPDHLGKAFVALPYMAIKDRSLSSGFSAYDYLSTERTNLYPLVGFETLGNDLLTRVASGATAKSGIEGALAEDLEAVIFVRFPQLPSSRAFGLAPVASMDEYMAQAPADRAQWKIVPVGPRPFPAELNDPKAPKDAVPKAEVALAIEVFLGLAGFVGLALRRRWVAEQAAKGRV